MSAVVVAALTLDLLVLILVRLGGLEAGRLMRDTTEALDAPFWVGSVSTLGIITWTIGVSIALFTALGTRRGGEVRKLLLVSGSFAAVLTFDDAFRFHEDIAPDVLGFPDRFVAPVYLLVAALIVVRFRRVIAATFWPPALLAALMFGLSIAADVLLEDAYYLEDAPKLVGIAAITVYLVVLSLDVLQIGRHEEESRQRERVEAGRERA